ncbi:MAG: hypothetical protein J5695_01770 [Bacteroidales bacterium]|nr:hypothetical protein [Bacteroidales bacterium]
MTPSKCERVLELPCYFFDINQRLRPAGFFDIAQDMAVHGSAMVGAPDWVLKERDIAWILARMHVHYERLPRLYGKVLLQTWHSGVSGPLFTRDFLMLDASGRTLVSATSSWLLMEVSSRSIAKADRIFDLLPPEPQWPERVLEDAPKIVWPRGVEPEFTAPHTVRYSDVDYNEHANNARYPVWAYDTLPQEIITGRQITDFYINYNRELHLGDTVELAGLRRDSESFIVEGRRDGTQNFICRIDFR